METHDHRHSGPRMKIKSIKLVSVSNHKKTNLLDFSLQLGHWTVAIGVHPSDDGLGDITALISHVRHVESGLVLTVTIMYKFPTNF